MQLIHPCDETRTVSVKNLRVETTDNLKQLLEDVSLELMPGEILGVVGESGSGKTTLGLALLGHCRRGLRIGAGTIRIGGELLSDKGPSELQRLRGRLVCYVPQDPATALNPALRITTQLAECLDKNGSGRNISLEDLLEDVMLPSGAGILDAFPHQLSGGQLQRVAIAMAFAARPRLIVMDEPTTGLDVSTQSHVLKTVRRLCESHRVAAVYVSHDIAVVASIANRTAVVYAGRIVEMGPTTSVLFDPSHPYTRALIRAVPDIDSTATVSGLAGQAPDGGADLKRCSFVPRCALAVPACRATVPPAVPVGPGHEVRCLRAADREHIHERSRLLPEETGSRSNKLLDVRQLTASHGNAKILHDITFKIGAGECVGVVGTSGSGKTTLARSLAGLHEDARGQVIYRDSELVSGTRNRDADTRRSIQYIFQNPYGSLNPRRSIGASVATALSQLTTVPAAERRARVLKAFDQVALPASALDRFPHEMSGGQRQRAAIARALIVDPDFLICDEITSALDVSVQARIIELLGELQREHGLTMLFVSHNLAVVRSIAQRVLVMQHGRIVESGLTEAVLTNPSAAVTRQLLQDAPRFSRARSAEYLEGHDVV
jgi:peptide/nickel transport system ATP-binding protein